MFNVTKEKAFKMRINVFDKPMSVKSLAELLDCKPPQI